MIFLVYDSAIDKEIEHILDELNLDGYTKWDNVSGYGGGEKRHGTKVWPGKNSMRIIVDKNGSLDELMHRVKALKESFIKPPALKIFKIPVEQIDL